MTAIGTINKSQIGKFRSIGDVKLHSKTKQVQDEVQDLRDFFAQSDRSKADYNGAEGLVLLDQVKRRKNEAFSAPLELSLSFKIES